MEIRNNKQVTDIIDYVLDTWDLTVNEEELLDSVLLTFSVQNIEKQKQLTHLINDETEELLEMLNDRIVLDYAIDLGGFLASDDEDGLEEALDDLKFNWVGKVTDTDMIKSLEDDGWNVTMDDFYPRHQADIVTQSDLEELTSNFLSADFQKRDLILKSSR